MVSNNTKNLFVYGVLTFPEILSALTGRDFRTKDATLLNFKRFGIFDNGHSRMYPAISYNKGDVVDGKIVFGVGEESLKVLDFFEDNEYEKREVVVSTGDGEYTALAYIWRDEFKNKLLGEWSSKKFEKKYLNVYINKIIPRTINDFIKSPNIS